MKWLMLLSLVTVASCGVNKEEYLFDKNSDEWSDVQSLGMLTCQEDNKVFNYIDQVNDFKRFKVGTIYKSNVKIKNGDADAGEINRYFKIHSIEKGVMVVYMKSTVASEDKRIIFTQESSKKIVATVSTGVCTVKTGAYTHNGLNGKTHITFNDSRISGKETDNTYYKIVETHTLHKDYPAFLLNWNSNIELQDKTSGTLYKKTYKAEFGTMKADDCGASTDPYCEFGDIEYKDAYEVQVDEDHYLEADPNKFLINFSRSNRAL